MINCYAFGWVPPFAQGLVRDIRVRWALEEAGVPYRVTLVGARPDETSLEGYRALQPFGQIPAIQDGDLTLFESGAIVDYIAERSAVLLPTSQPDRAHVRQWMLAALNTVEVPVMWLAGIDLFYADQPWSKEARPGAVERVRQRLGQLATRVRDGEYLVGRFSAADILMTTTLRMLRQTDLVEEHPRLVAYKERCEARPAFKKSLDDQLSAFAA